MSSTWSLTKVFNPRPGWYRGELHTHSTHSDGYHSPAQLARMARAGGLDFLAITDHNRIDAFTKSSPDPNFLIIQGMEITLQNGHFNVYGLTGWGDWMENICIGMFTIKLAGKYSTTTALMRRTAAQGLLNSINHPLRPPFQWQDEATALQNVHCLEIWNKPAWPDPTRSNARAIAMWTRWLNGGYRTTAVGGSDHHVTDLKPGEKRLTERLGWPRNYIYAEELSGAAILAGLRQHRVYVSMGPEVDFQAVFENKTYGIGADLGPVQGPLAWQARVKNCPQPALAQLIKNGEVLVERPVEDDQATIHYHDTASPTRSAWYRFDVYAESGRLLALTNPIFAGPRRPPELKTYGDFI